jgi:hypothetical protein
VQQCREAFLNIFRHPVWLLVVISLTYIVFEPRIEPRSVCIRNPVVRANDVVQRIVRGESEPARDWHMDGEVFERNGLFVMTDGRMARLSDVLIHDPNEYRFVGYWHIGFISRSHGIIGKSFETWIAFCMLDISRLKREIFSVNGSVVRIDVLNPKPTNIGLLRQQVWAHCLPMIPQRLEGGTMRSAMSTASIVGKAQEAIRIHWSGLGLEWLLVLTIMSGLIPSYSIATGCVHWVMGISRRRWLACGRCGSCGYSLEGLEGGVCPECGEAISPFPSPAKAGATSPEGEDK